MRRLIYILMVMLVAVWSGRMARAERMGMQRPELALVKNVTILPVGYVYSGTPMERMWKLTTLDICGSHFDRKDIQSYFRASFLSADDSLWINAGDRVFCIVHNTKPLYVQQAAVPTDRQWKNEIWLNVAQVDAATDSARALALWLGLKDLSGYFLKDNPTGIGYQRAEDGRRECLWYTDSICHIRAYPVADADSVTSKEEFRASLSNVYSVDFSDPIEAATAAEVNRRLWGIGAVAAAILSALLVVFLVWRRRHRAQAKAVTPEAVPATDLPLQPGVRRILALASANQLPVAEDWNRLEDDFKRCLPQFLQRLHGLNNALGERDRRLCMLVLVGCTPSDVSVLFAQTKQSVSNLRARLYEKLFGEKGSAAKLDQALREHFLTPEG